MSKEYYIIKTFINNSKFYYYIIMENNKKEIVLKFGGIKEQCIRIRIYKKEKIALIEDLVYKKDCSIFTKLDKNNNKIELLLKSSLYFCIKKFPEVSNYQISDMSYIQCNNNQRIVLSDLYVVKYGKTWYEKVFNAMPIEEQKKDVENAKKIINEKLNTIINLDYDNFIKRYYIQTKNLNNKNIDIIKNAYKKNMSVKDYLFYFFDNNLDCKLYVLFFQIIFGFLLYGKYWEISKNVIEEYDVKLEFYESEKLERHYDLANLHQKLDELNSNHHLSNKI